MLLQHVITICMYTMQIMGIIYMKKRNADDILIQKYTVETTCDRSYVQFLCNCQDAGHKAAKICEVCRIFDNRFQ